MKSFSLATLFLLLLSLSTPARAGLLVDLGGGYFSDALTTTSADTSVKYAYNLGVLFSFNKNFWGGWSYAGFNTQDTRTGTDSQLIGQDTGPTVKWQLGRAKNFFLGLTYNILSKASYTNSGTSEDWEGTSFSFQFGVMPEIRDDLRLGIAMNYFSASYTLRKVNGVESTVSYSKQWIYPSFMLTKEF